MSDDPFDDPEWLEFAQHAREVLEPMVKDSSIGVSMYSGEVDPKMAIEIGYLLLLDKPIIALVSPGAKVPGKLALVAEEIVEADWSNPDSTSRRLKEAVKRVEAKLDAAEKQKPDS